MSKVRKAAKRPNDGSAAWRVVNDLAHAHPVTAAELDAVEAFLMPMLNAPLSKETRITPGKTDPETATAAAPTHNRPNAMLLEER